MDRSFLKEFLALFVCSLALFFLSSFMRPAFALQVSEGQGFWVLETITVQYGVPGKYISVVFSPSNGSYQQCTASGDPAPGTLKHCIVPEQTCTTAQKAGMPDGACKAEQTQAEKCAALTSSASNSMATSSTATSLCYAGCQYDNGVSVSSSGAVKYKWVPSGSTCDGTETTTAPSAADAAASSAADSACAAGMCRATGTLNGVAINKCVVCNVVETSSDKTTSSSSSSTASGVTTSKDGTVSGTESTKCVGNTCTTTTTVTTTSSDGTSSTSTSTATESKDSFCKSNPKSAACITSSWAGSCAAGFSCDGDAVSCAIARESHVRNCTLFDQETTLSTLGRDSANGQAQPAGHPGANPSVVNVSGSIDQTNPFGSSCPADFALDAMGVSVNVPLSSACGILQMLGYIAVAFAMYSAARITLGGLTS